jgi:hypothetical protein
MPKEEIVIDQCAGATPSEGGSGHAIRFHNTRVDTANSILVPENADLEYSGAQQETKETEANNLLPMIEKAMYVDGQNYTLAIRLDGKITVDGVVYGDIPVGPIPSIDVIGRVAIITGGSGYSKIVRIKYPATTFDYINFSVGEIVCVDDLIRTEDLNMYGDLLDLIPLNEVQYIALYGGLNNLVLIDFSGASIVFYSTPPLCDYDIKCISVSYGEYLDAPNYVGFIDKVYYSYYDDMDVAILRTSSIDIGKCYVNSHSNVSADFVSEDLENLDGSVVLSKETITLSLVIGSAESDVPSGYPIQSIARTKNKLYFGFGRVSAGVGAKIGWEDETHDKLGEDQDLLLAINISDWTDGAIFTTADDAYSNIYKSWLPWMPYRKEIVAYKASYGWDASQVESYNDPNAIAYLPGHTGINWVSILGFVSEDGQDPSHPWTGRSMKLPGGCGAIAPYIQPSGKLVIFSYIKDFVGYMIVCDNHTMIPHTFGWDDEALENVHWSAQDNNGCGVISTYWSNPYYYLTAAHPMPDSSGNFDYMTDGYMFYCWNGKDLSEYPGYIYDTVIGLTCYIGGLVFNQDIIIRRHFDDENTGHDNDITQCGRACLFTSSSNPTGSIIKTANSTYTRATNATPVAAVNIAGTTKDIVTMGTYLPILVTDYSDYFNRRVSNVSYWNYSHSVFRIASIDYISDNYIVGNHEYVSKFLPYSTTAQKHTMFSYKDSLLSVQDDIVINEQLSSAVVVPTDPEEYGIDTNLFSITATPIIGEDGFALGSTIRYKIALVYDGITVSPLSITSKDITEAGETGGNSFYTTINLSIQEAQVKNVGKRVTAVNIYASPLSGSEDEMELYRLVKTIPLTDEYFFLADGYYSITPFNDYGNRFATFNADSGYSETLESISLARNCQCVCNGYLFVGDVSVNNVKISGVNTDNIVVRSLPLQPSAFNYIEDFAVLGFTPVQLVPYNGRVYAFGNERYSIINADSLAIEHTSNSVGLLSKTHVVVNDYGIFLYYSGNVYHVDGAKVTTIGDPILTNVTGREGVISLDELDITQGVYLGYCQSRNCIVLAGSNLDTIRLFCYGLATGKWATYDIENGAVTSGYGMRILGLYDKNDTTVIVFGEYDEAVYLDYYSYSLFSATGSRDMLIEMILDFGDPDQYKKLYRIQAYNGTLKTVPTITLDCDNYVVPKEVSIDASGEIDWADFIQGDLIDDNIREYMHKVISVTVEDNEPISAIRMLIRKYVVK